MLELKVSITDKVKELIEGVLTSQGGTWIEKKNLRTEEAAQKSNNDFNPKAARTRSF